MTDLPTFVLEREFKAPRELVWRAWTDPELLPRWYGPQVETVIHRHDLKPGGLWLTEMKWGENAKYDKVEFIEISPPEKLVWLHSPTDADWNISANPMMPDWPRVLHTTVTFEAHGEATKTRLTWVPHEASEAELAFFAGALSGMDKGWGTGMDLLADLLAELQR